MENQPLTEQLLLQYGFIKLPPREGKTNAYFYKYRTRGIEIFYSTFSKMFIFSWSESNPRDYNVSIGTTFQLRDLILTLLRVDINQ